MKKILFCLALLAGSVWSNAPVYSQNMVLDWVKPFTGVLADSTVGKSIKLDLSDHVYTTGFFSGTVDFDPGVGSSNLSSAGGSDVFISKLDPDGNFLWAKSIGGTLDDLGSSLVLDNSGNSYITGYFQQTVDFDPGSGISTLTAAGEKDVFVLKLDPNGNFLWVKSIGGTGSESGNCIALDAAGNIHLVGSFTETADFDPGTGTTNLTSTGNSDVFILKLDTNGNFLWARSFGAANEDLGNGISLDANGNVYTTGSFFETVDFDPGAGTMNLVSAGNSDIFISRLDANGNFVWAKRIGAFYNDPGFAIVADAAGNVFTTGMFQGIADFNPGTGTNNLTSAGSSDVFILKLDTNGEYQWARNVGNNYYEEGHSIALDGNGGVYTTGFFQHTADFDPGAGTYNLNSYGAYEVFVLKLNAYGNFIWAKAMGGGAYDVGNAIVVDAQENVFTTGYFKQTADFNPGAGITNLTSTGNTAAFVHKLTYCSPVYSTDAITSCGPYTWINGVEYTASTNSPVFTLMSSTDCDSVVTLNLIINPVNSSVSMNGIQLTADQQNNAAYQWIDCDNANTPIAGATARQFTPVANGNYAVVVSANGCTDTSNCIAVTTLGLEASEQAGWKWYPNPASEKLVVEAMAAAHVELITVYGTIVHSAQLKTGTNSIDVGNLAPGVYFIVSDSGIRVSFVKQ